MFTLFQPQDRKRNCEFRSKKPKQIKEWRNHNNSSEAGVASGKVASFTTALPREVTSNFFQMLCKKILGAN
jgi:hypothetical protein